jgi:hypothetical protein
VIRILLRRVLVIVISLAFVGAGAVASASAVPMTGQPCPHEHGMTHEHAMAHGDHQPKQQPDDHSPAGCLSCCLAACIAVPNLPPASVTAGVPISVTLIVYRRATPTLTGLSVVPDPAPPRPVA